MYVNIQLMHLGKVREVVVENEDGGHTVFIDDRLSEEGRREAYTHAMRHINGDDFSKYDVGMIEKEAHKNAPEGELRSCH